MEVLQEKCGGPVNIYRMAIWTYTVSPPFWKNVDNVLFPILEMGTLFIVFQTLKSHYEFFLQMCWLYEQGKVEKSSG